MRCRNCDYRLWNLTSRQCPECGEPFLPSQYDFVVNSVRFCCPHCRQEYYGTGERGHLAPFAFNCVKCGQFVDMDQMVLLPTEGVTEEQTVAEALPWLVRDKRGLYRGWIGTVGMAMVRPRRVMELAPIDDADAAAWGFAFCTHLVIWFCSTLPAWLLFGFGGLGPLPEMCSGSIMVAVAVAIALAVWGLTTHGVLRITGGTQAPIGRTYQALCFSSGANILTGIPCLGLYVPVGWCWWLISAVLMVRAGQQVSGLRATAAVLVFPILLGIGGVTALVWSIHSAQSAMQTAMRTAADIPSPELDDLTDALIAYGQDHGGQGPRHALELALADDWSSFFVVANTLTTADASPVGGSDLAKFASGAEHERKRIADAAADALPDDVIAHRVGDFVFTYHGMALNQSPGGLWIVVESPDPDQNAPPAASGRALHVGELSGLTLRHHPGVFAAQLQAQNRLRAQCGLAPLPDPSTVTHGQPATASAVRAPSTMGTSPPASP